MEVLSDVNAIVEISAVLKPLVVSSVALPEFVELLSVLAVVMGK